MTTTIITDQPTIASYVATAGQTTFAFSFQIFNGSEDIVVTVNGVETEAFTVALVGSEGGTITLDTPCLVGDVVVLTRTLELKRITMFGNSGPVAMSEVDEEFNRIVGMIQDLDREFEELGIGISYSDAQAVSAVGAALVAGDNITLTVGATTIEIDGAADEYIRDLIAGFIQAGVGIDVTHNDAANTLTIGSTGGGGGGGLTTEDVRDVIGTALVASTGITITVNDAADTITIAATGAYTDEQARDAVGAAITAGTGITKVINDAADTITISANSTKTLQLAVSSGAFKPRATGGAAAGTVETTTNKVNLDVYDFDSATDEFVQVPFVPPKQWNGGTITAQFLWMVASGSGNVVWGIQGRNFNDDDPLDSAFGTAVTITDGVTAVGDLMISGVTAAMTIAGTLTAEGLIMLQIYRDADNASDTCAVDARLIGVRLKLGLDKFDDA